VEEIHAVLLGHLYDLYHFYGELSGSRMARKHIAWYTRGLADSASFRHAMNQLEGTQAQLEAVNDFFWRARERSNRLIYLDAAPEACAAA
jgi:tRNA-dihydrouridine synthase B